MNSILIKNDLEHNELASDILSRNSLIERKFFKKKLDDQLIYENESASKQSINSDSQDNMFNCQQVKFSETLMQSFLQKNSNIDIKLKENLRFNKSDIFFNQNEEKSLTHRKSFLFRKENIMPSSNKSNLTNILESGKKQLMKKVLKDSHLNFVS